MMNSPISFSCGNPQHREEIASFYCLEQQCEASHFYCVLCLQDLHSGHWSRPIKFLWHEVERDAEALDNSIGALAKIDSLSNQIVNLCSLIKDEHLREIILSSVHQFFSRLDESCRSKHISELSKILSKNAPTKIPRVKELFIAYCADWKKNYEENPSNEPNFRKFLRQLIEGLKQKHSTLDDALKKNEMDISLAQIFSGETSQKKFIFSASCMHTGLSFVDKNKIKINGYADYNYFAVCEPQLSLSKAQKISFKMVNISSYVTVGICKKNKIEASYEFMLNGLGHGSFQISHDGYLWSDTDISLNETHSGWYYNTGDTVTVQFSPKTKKLKFTRNQQSANPLSYEFPFSWDKGDKLHFCVTLNSQPEEIQIIP